MAEPQVVFGSGHVHVTQIKDALGNDISPPQVIAAPAVQNVSADFGKADIKSMYGQKEFAIHAAQGKKSTEVSFECGEMYLKMLNMLYFGQSVSSGSHAINRDDVGTIIPDNISTTNVIVRSNKTFQISKVTGVGTVKIGTAVTVSTNADAVATSLSVIPAGSFKYSNGIYTFSADDRKAGLKVQITNTVIGSAATTLVSTLTIPASLSYNTNLFASASSVKKLTAGAVTEGWFTKDTYAPSHVLVDKHYQSAGNGTFSFFSTEAAAGVEIIHWTDNSLVNTKIAALPATGFVTIIDPPSSSVFVANISVVAAGVSYALGAVTPTTGQYLVSSAGVYTFAAADIGVILSVTYTTDFEYLTITPPNAGVFVADKGVRGENGLPFTRVVLTTPVALVNGQYAVSASGTYYFDNSNNNQRVFIDYEYSSDAGATLVIANNDMGSTPIVSLDISGSSDGQDWLIKYPRAIPKSFGFATKMDDFGTYKVTFDVIAERMSGTVGTVYMTA